MEAAALYQSNEFLMYWNLITMRFNVVSKSMSVWEVAIAHYTKWLKSSIIYTH